MSRQRQMKLAFVLTALMVGMPWAAADTSSWIGPTSVASNGQDRVVDGWNVPSNATILDSWMLVEDKMVDAGNGSEWRVDTSTNFTVGSFSDATMGHFDGRLSLEPDAAVSQVDSFTDVSSIGFNPALSETGNTSIWGPGLPASINGSQVGSRLHLAHGVIPANAHDGSIVAATMLGSPVPGGETAGLVLSPFSIPSPVNHFNASIWNWRHTGADDALWVEYRLDNGPWTWLEPTGGYNDNVTVNGSLTPAGTPNNSSTFPVWTDSTWTGWVENVFNLDNLSGIGNAAAINFRFMIHTDASSPGRPGWIVDDLEISNVGGATGYWHHGCYVQTGTCGYSNNAHAALQGSVDLTNANAGSEIQILLEWDLEGSSFDNFCVELSSNNNSWTDISSSTSSTTTNCRSRSGSIPGSGTSVGGTTYYDETNGFITLELAVPSTFQNSGATDLRIVVQTDSSVTSGGSTDNMEGLTIDRITVVDGSNTILDIDHLSSANTMWDYSVSNGINDWSYLMIGAGGMLEGYGFEDSPASTTTGMPAGWWANGDWEFGQLASASEGPVSWPSGPFGLGTNLAGNADDQANDHLYTPGYTIPAGASARLTFDSWMCADNGYGGGAVFISTDNSSWSHFNPGNNWYDTTAYAWRTGGILAGLGIFDGSNNIPQGGWNCNGPHDLWDTHAADISSYSGQTVWFRFTYEPYAWCCNEGWYLDDVGLEVDYFMPEGDWVSDVIQLDQLGGGFVDVDGVIPDDTWVTATILDAAGNDISGLGNVSFPVSLHGIDRDVTPAIRVQINMGTDDPFLTPVIDAVRVGSVRLLDAQGPNNGWDVHPSLDLWDQNLTNNGSSILTISSDFVHSSKPITGISVQGAGAQTTVRAIGANGQVLGTSGLTGTIAFAEPQPGFGVEVQVNPGGRVSELWAEGEFGQPAVYPRIDATQDGSVDWSFETGAAYGFHGWQTFLHETTDDGGTTTHGGNMATDLQVGTNGGMVSVLVPGDATVTSTTLSLDVAGIAGTTVDVSVGASAATTFDGGLNTHSLSAAQIAHINMVSAQSGLQSNRDWRLVEFDLASSGFAVVDVNAITIGYSIIENVTGLTQQFIDHHAAEIAAGAGASVDMPVRYIADAGAVVIDGGIYHELMVTNHPFSAPGTLYPDGQVIEVTTRHHHLYDNDELSKVAFSAVADDGTTVVYELLDPTGAATFSQITGQNLLPLESDSSVTEVNDVMVVKWRFRLTWIWDDVSHIVWTAQAYDSSGESMAPATAQSGGAGSQAVENDLEVNGFIVRDADGRDLSNRFSPDYPFHAMSGQELNVSGTVRFQNTANHRPLASDFAMIVNVSGTELPLDVDGDGVFSGLVTLPEGVNHTFSPTIGRVGPVTGATGANDTTVSPPAVLVQNDDEAPVASPFLVSTSVGLLDANGYVWDPVNPLTVHITVSDAQDRAEEVMLHFWREGIDDANADGVAQPGEYQTMTQSLFALRSGSQQVTFSNIQVAANGFNAKVSLYLTGTDWAGNAYQDGGTGGGPGLDADWATLQTAQNTETTVLNTGFSLDSAEEHLLAGQEHTFEMTIQDANGVQTLDDIIIYLGGRDAAPFGELHYDPRQQTLTPATGSHVIPHGAAVTELSEDTSQVEIRFEMDWNTPRADPWYVPGLTIIDDTQTVANVNNLNELRWQIDNILVAQSTLMSDLTPPLSPATPDQVNVRQGDEISIDGVVVYDATGVVLQSPSTNLSVRGQILYGSTVVESIVAVQEGGAFSMALVLPARAPLTPSMPVELLVLNVPGVGDSVADTAATIVVDSDAPTVAFDSYRFPVSSLTLLESDQLGAVSIDLLVEDSGGMGEGNLTIHWNFLRNGLPRMGTGGTGSLALVAIDGAEHHYGGTLDMRPADGLRLLDGDQIIVWVEGADLAGNPIEGEATDGSPRVPSLMIIEFVPVITGWTVDPSSPDYGAMVHISVHLANEGLRAGSLNLSLVESINGEWHIHETVMVNLSSMTTAGLAEFDWEAWKAGPADLHVVIDGEDSSRTPVQSFEVRGGEDDGAAVGLTTLLIAVVALLVFVVIVLLLVIVLRRPSESVDEYMEEDWDDEEAYGGPTGIRLDFEDSTLWNTAARHGIHDKEAFLAHAYGYDRDGDGFLDAEELDRAAKDFRAILAQPTVSEEAQYPLDFNDETVAHVIQSHGILDATAFLGFARAYDADGNGYLNHSELSRAADDYVRDGHNAPPAAPTAPDPRLLAIGEVQAALPSWPEATIAAWLDKGWTAMQIIEAHATPTPPPAPAGFGDAFESPEAEPQAEPEPAVTEPVVAEPIITEPTSPEPADVPESAAAPAPEPETTPVEDLPSAAALKRMKKVELVDLAEARGIDARGTKADIISRLTA